MGTAKLTILVVDDEESIRDLVVSFLMKSGHWCLKVSDGMEALDQLKRYRINAVAADIKMPRMDGIRLTEAISERYPGLPIMVMTGFAQEISAGEALSAGASDFIQKPFSIDEFTIRFNKVVKNTSYAGQGNPPSAEEEDEEISSIKGELEKVLAVQ